MNLNFVFKSPDHLRYENGRHDSGPHGGARRAVKVEPNINGGEGYTVTMYNLDGNHPVWQNNVQMAPKQMKIVSQDSSKVVLRGYGYDMMGASFADYGLTIHYNDGEISKCILHMHDRNVDIEYLKGETISNEEPQAVALSKRANAQFQNESVTDGRQLLVQIYRSIKSDPTQLKNVTDFSSLGTSFLLMLDQNLSDDIDTLQMMASVSYLCISKAIRSDSTNLNLYKDRLLMLRFGHEPFRYTVMHALDIDASPLSFMGSMASYSARDAIYKMEIADLELHPQLHRQVQLFKERKAEFDEMVGRQFFMPEKTLDKVIHSGQENHTKLLAYLDNRVIEEGDVDF